MSWPTSSLCISEACVSVMCKSGTSNSNPDPNPPVSNPNPSWFSWIRIQIQQLWIRHNQCKCNWPTRQGPSFNNSTNVLFKVPTDGLILKGWYSTITIAVYGQLTTVPKARASPPPPPPPQQHVRQPPPQGLSIVITFSTIDLIIDVDFIVPFKIILNKPNNFGDIKNGCKPNTTSVGSAITNVVQICVYECTATFWLDKK